MYSIPSDFGKIDSSNKNNDTSLRESELNRKLIEYNQKISPQSEVYSFSKVIRND